MTNVIERKNSSPIVPQSQYNEIVALDDYCKAATAHLQQCFDDGNHMLHALLMGNVVNRISALLTDNVMKDVMTLQDKKAGFATDKKDKGGYSVAEVRSVLVMALVRGLRIVGNEFNIIAGNLYVTKEGFERLVTTYPGVSRLEIEMGAPAMTQSGALCACSATWVYHGRPMSIECLQTPAIDCRIPIRVNAAMGVDAILGKAKRKLLARIYERITGANMEAEVEDLTPPTVVEDAKPIALGVEASKPVERNLL